MQKYVNICIIIRFFVRKGGFFTEFEENFQNIKIIMDKKPLMVL